MIFIYLYKIVKMARDALIYSAVVGGLDIFALVYQFTNMKAINLLDNIGLQILIANTIYFVYMFIINCKDTMCNNPNIDQFYFWAQNTLFKFLFCLQGYLAYAYLTLKFSIEWRMNGEFLQEFTFMYYTLVLYILMAFSVYIWHYTLAIANFLKDLLVLCIIVLVLWAVYSFTKAINGNGKSSDWGIFVPALGMYLLIFVMAFNSFQFYNFIVSRKTAQIEPTPYTAI